MDIWLIKFNKSFVTKNGIIFYDEDSKSKHGMGIIGLLMILLIL